MPQDGRLEQLRALVSIFSANIAEYKNAQYDESNPRTDFIDKFFALLDWDVANNQQYLSICLKARICLDILDLKENFLEADLEKTVLQELEKFILEFGRGFTFVERQKRMTTDGDGFTLDLLIYHRDLKRLVANESIGLILCTKAS
jgi:hypothetical protein